MAAFDPKEYEQQVVRPLRGRSGRLPDDLLTRYAIRLDFSDAEVAARVAEVRSHWNKSAQSTAKSKFVRSVYNAFLREDEELRSAHGEDMLRLSWWREHEAARTRDRGQQIDELITMLREEFGELGLINPGQLNALRETFGQLPPHEVDRALDTAGIRLSTPSDLPRTSGLQETLYRRLKSLLAEAGVSSIPELLHGELTALRVLTTFRSTPPHAAGLTADAVRQAIDRENRRSGNRAAREALGILNTAATSDGVDLRSLTLFHLLDDVRRHHDNRAPTPVLLRQLRLAKLDEDEARQAVVSVLGETAGSRTGAQPDRPEIGELLENGLLRAAEQALADLTDPDAAKSARELVERQSNRVREFREAAHRALADGSESEALRQLRLAARTAVDDEGIAAELRRIPLPPVREISAQPDELGVRVSWRAPVDHEAGTRYRLVRRADRPPADPEDGELVSEDTTTVARDSEAPAGVTVRYAVFAAVEGGAWSRPEEIGVEILPPVRAVDVKVARGVLEANWKAHPDAVAVDVRRIDGSGETAIATTGTTSFRDSGADVGATCTYVLQARYRRADGSDAVSEEVRVESTDRTARTLPPVTGLEFRSFGREVVLSWIWPEQARIAEISWSGEQDSGRSRLSRQEYRDAGGFRFSPGSAPVRVRVSAVAEDATSPASEIEISGRQPRIDYTVQRRSRPLIGGGTARITLTADQAVPVCAVLVVVARGRAMPTKPGDGTVVQRLELEFPAGEPIETTVELPKLRRPYWLRCFTETTGVRLVDPSTAQLKAT